MESETGIKLLKPNQKLDSSNSDNSQVFRIKVIRQTDKSEEQIMCERAYLKDFSQLYAFALENSESIDSEIVLLLITLRNSLATRLQLTYESDIIYSDGIPYEDILRYNRRVLEKARAQLLEYRSRTHLSYVDERYISELEELLRAHGSNVIRGCTYRFDSLDLVNKAKVKNGSALFRALMANGIDLGTKSPSKASKRNINHIIAESYYGILCSDDLRQEFIDVLSMSKDIEDCSLIIKELFNKADCRSFAGFREFVENRSMKLEAFLLIYIINELLYSFDIEDIEEYFNDDDIDLITTNAEKTVSAKVRDMYLSL